MTVARTAIHRAWVDLCVALEPLVKVRLDCPCLACKLDGQMASVLLTLMFGGPEIQEVWLDQSMHTSNVALFSERTYVEWCHSGNMFWHQGTCIAHQFETAHIGGPIKGWATSSKLHFLHAFEPQDWQLREVFQTIHCSTGLDIAACMIMDPFVCFLGKTVCTG